MGEDSVSAFFCIMSKFLISIFYKSYSHGETSCFILVHYYTLETMLKDSYLKAQTYFRLDVIRTEIRTTTERLMC